MGLQILTIENEGDASEEYIRFEVLEDCNLKYYGLADTTYTDASKISNKLRHFYWFASQAVKKGEEVTLHTGKGKKGKYTSDSGTKGYRLYWGLKSAVWNDDGDAAVLFEINSWKTKRAKPSSSSN